ncbi:MAG: hypothetical protein OXL38_01140 [Gammaproteobacteria bacterium]|nr:hypothetical protein [Gammaproteobacteria bacterium]
MDCGISALRVRFREKGPGGHWRHAPPFTEMASVPSLPIHDMHERHPGLTEATASSNSEALRVCLDRHHHSPTDFDIDNDGQTISVEANWHPTDTQTRRAWANEIVATEAGAYACVLAAFELAEGLVAVERADTGTGTDYYLSSAEDPDDLESALRVEVSGLNAGSPTEIRSRLKQKVTQAAAGDSALPALAGVVGFRERLILLSRVQHFAEAPQD